MLGQFTGMKDVINSADFTANAVRRIAGSPEKVERLQSNFPQKYPNIMKILEQEAAFNKTRGIVGGGSPTMQKAAADEALGMIVNPKRGGLTGLFAGIGDEIILTNYLRAAFKGATGTEKLLRQGLNIDPKEAEKLAQLLVKKGKNWRPGELELILEKAVQKDFGAFAYPLSRILGIETAAASQNE